MAGITQCGAREEARTMPALTSGVFICSTLTDLCDSQRRQDAKSIALDPVQAVRISLTVDNSFSDRYRITKVHDWSIRSATWPALPARRRAFT